MLDKINNNTPMLKSPYKFPPPPPLPPYDPKEEAPKFDWYRLWYGLPKYEKHPDLPARVGTHAASEDRPDWRGVIKSNVVPLPEVEPYSFGLPQDPRYFFFDTPDYADPFKKLWYSTKFFAWSGGLVVTLMGILSGRDATNFKDLRYLAGRHFVPLFAGGMVASTAVITIANLRGNKDDYTNYVLAGLVAGAATGRANYYIHLRHTLFWVLGAVTVKYNAEVNGNLLPRMSPYAVKHGTSGMSAEGGFWTGNFHWFPYHKQGDPGRDARGVKY